MATLLLAGHPEQKGLRMGIADNFAEELLATGEIQVQPFVTLKISPTDPANWVEAIRYAGCGEPDQETVSLARERLSVLLRRSPEVVSRRVAGVLRRRL